jgi:ABC-type amino acid transport substrate-binding protein
MADGDTPRGLSISVWRLTAETAGVSYEWVKFDTVEAALGALAEGRLDGVVGPISITSERARAIDFTQPYFSSSVGLLLPHRDSEVQRVLAPFLTNAFLVGTGTLLLVLTGVGFLFWLTERRKNPDMFPPSPLKGIGNGIWFSLVTMTTVGYGDRVPITPWGRVIAGVWMVIAMLTVSSLTAGIATALTVSSLEPAAIRSMDQIRGKRIAARVGTNANREARKYGARVVEVAGLPEGAAALRAGKVDGVIDDRPILEYFLSQNPDLDVRLSEIRHQPQGYGFALRANANLEQQVNVALLEKLEDESVKRISERWLSGSEVP